MKKKKYSKKNVESWKKMIQKVAKREKERVSFSESETKKNSDYS